MCSTRSALVRQKAYNVMEDAMLFPETAHVAQQWLINARDWAWRNSNASLERHISQRIAELSQLRRYRLEIQRRALACGHA